MGKRFISEKTKALYAELSETLEAATSTHCATDNFLKYIYSVLVVTNNQKIWSKYLAHEFSDILDIFEQY